MGQTLEEFGPTDRERSGQRFGGICPEKEIETRWVLHSEGTEVPDRL